MAEKVDQINMDPLDTTETDKWVGRAAWWRPVEGTDHR